MATEANSYDTPVGSVMITDVPTARADLTVKEGAGLMQKNDCGCLIVVNELSAIGIVTEKDIVQKVTAEGIDASKVLIEDIMSSPLITVPSNSTVRDVSEAMRTYKVRKMVVIDERGALVGLVTSVELAKWGSAKSNYSDPAMNALAELKPGEGPYD